MENNQRSSVMTDKESIENLDLYYISFQIRITDSGQGIAPEDIKKLFINFSKLADHNGNNKQGTGLGLSICKHVVEQMGGDVKVESQGLGHGATFII